MWWATRAMKTIYLLITIAYAFCRSQDVASLAGALVAVASYLAMVPDSLTYHNYYVSLDYTV